MPLLDMEQQQWQHWRLSNIEQTLGHVAAATLDIVTPTLTRRDSATTTASSGNTPASTQNIQTVAIALGAGIPLGCAVVVLFLLHRRHLKRQKLEDLNDPHKSLDFGMYPSGPSTKGKGGPEMSIKDLGDPRSRRIRGMSMDMGSPYILPRELNGSRASLHSMSRSLREENDPYRPVTMVKNDWESARGPRQPPVNGSLYSAAGSMQSHLTNEKAGLVNHATPMSLSQPNRAESISPNPSRPSADFPIRRLQSSDRKPVPARKNSAGSSEKSLPPVTPSRSLSVATTTLEDFVPPPPPPPPKDEPQVTRPPRTSSISAGSTKSVKRPARKDSIAKHPVPAVVEPFPDALPQLDFDYDNFQPPLPLPPPQEHPYEEHNLAMPQPQNNRMSILGLRPLPADLPDDNPEVRANRIRSFYKEYFDESRPNPQGGYVDDYDADYLADYAIYDHAAGGFLSGNNKPFAQPMQRRAMTPPPRGHPNSFNYGPGPHRRHMSTQSGGGYGPRGRAQSAPKKRLPPPQALTSLPTPYMLRNDSSIFSANEFAPPSSFRDRQGGRTPDSPLGTSRPYSPMVAAHSPLIKSYDELAAIPSPYMLRKSGTFTSLDFAPPSRLRVDGTASDAGSIRSNRSGISAVQQHAIRGGAYRVSRIPTEMVTTKAALADQLKPRWDMRNGNNIMG